MDQMTSKGLEALKHLYAKLSVKSSIDDISENLKEYDIVEKELKEYESYKGFLDNVENGKVTYTPRDIWEEERKKLKALEIIRNKHISKYAIDTFEQDWNLIEVKGKDITQEEYDLLKEVLK
ncbi:MAG: hypothetical protein IJG09_09940 [Methanobrevibacter sp.]|nr:hypothetical protein [Methanobrevibacter sp.]